MAKLVREGVCRGYWDSAPSLPPQDIQANTCPAPSRHDEMLALGHRMKGLNNSVFELVSDHLGDDEEWA